MIAPVMFCALNVRKPPADNLQDPVFRQPDMGAVTELGILFPDRRQPLHAQTRRPIQQQLQTAATLRSVGVTGPIIPFRGLILAPCAGVNSIAVRPSFRAQKNPLKCSSGPFKILPQFELLSFFDFPLFSVMQNFPKLSCDSARLRRVKTACQRQETSGR